MTVKNRKGGFYRAHPLPGGGPWMVLPDCPGPAHNTLRAAHGWGRGGGSRQQHPRCVCPRAAALLECERIERRERERRVRQAEQEEGMPVKQGSSYMRNAAQGVAVPELTWARCRTPEGLQLLDEMTEVCGPAQMFRARKVQAMCFRCVEQQPCAVWALKAEDPPGSWGGVYGGMTAAQRKNVIKQFGSGAK